MWTVDVDPGHLTGQVSHAISVVQKTVNREDPMFVLLLKVHEYYAPASAGAVWRCGGCPERLSD